MTAFFDIFPAKVIISATQKKETTFEQKSMQSFIIAASICNCPTKPVMNLHHQVINHAQHTKKPHSKDVVFLYIHFTMFSIVTIIHVQNQLFPKEMFQPMIRFHYCNHKRLSLQWYSYVVVRR